MVKIPMLIVTAVIIGLASSSCSLSPEYDGPVLTIVLQADLSGNSSSVNERDMKKAISIIESRLVDYGIEEPVVRQEDSNRIILQLPGTTNIEEVKTLVTSGFLEFREVELDMSGQPVQLRDYSEMETLAFIDKSESGRRIFTAESVAQEKTEYDTIGYLVQDENGICYRDSDGNPSDNTTLSKYYDSFSWIPARGNHGTQLTGDYLDSAEALVNQASFDQEYSVSIEWNNEGSVIFDEIAKRIYNSGFPGSPQRKLGIFLDDTLLSAPEILRESYMGSGQIAGNFTRKEAEELATLLNSGALPVRVNVVDWYTD